MPQNSVVHRGARAVVDAVWRSRSASGRVPEAAARSFLCFWGKDVDVPCARVSAAAWIIVIVCVEVHSVLHVAWIVKRVGRLHHSRWRLREGGVNVQREVVRFAADLRHFR